MIDYGMGININTSWVPVPFLTVRINYKILFITVERRREKKFFNELIK